ncbi:MAG: hypothetical protein K0R09_1695 [Clostridiales bacterium]|jgi:hypothetical protein|nr:hypothetical protein [Clostridiales bacterium]
MLNEKKALLLIGSPKTKNGTSEALGNYLLQGLGKKGYEWEKLHILSILKNNGQELFNKVEDADIIILSFPLYVDSLPSPVIRALELIASNRGGRRSDKKRGLISITNCGFPETFHNNTAVKICKNFADKNDFKWLGGFALGGGGALNGRPIEQLGGMTRNIVKALDMIAEAISNDESIPPEAFDLMSRKLIPQFLYTTFANSGWKTQAKKFNANKLLYAKPYIKD